MAMKMAYGIGTHGGNRRLFRSLAAVGAAAGLGLTLTGSSFAAPRTDAPGDTAGTTPAASTAPPSGTTPPPSGTTAPPSGTTPPPSGAPTVPPSAAEAQQIQASAAYNVKVRDLERKVNELKEQVFRSKARLNLLKETVLHGVIAGARSAIVFKNEMGGMYIPISTSSPSTAPRSRRATTPATTSSASRRRSRSTTARSRRGTTRSRCSSSIRAMPTVCSRT